MSISRDWVSVTVIGAAVAFVLFAVAWVSPALAPGGQRTAVLLTQNLASPHSPLPPTAPPHDEETQMMGGPDAQFSMTIPKEWFGSVYGSSASIDNYDGGKIDQWPDEGINIHFGLGEIPFPQTFAQWLAERRAFEAASAYEPLRPITASLPITLGGYTGFSEVNEVLMESGDWWPIQQIYLAVDDRWVAGITIKPISAPDYAKALRILETLQITPRCEDAAELRTTFEALISQELEARQSQNWQTFTSLVHPETDPKWLEQQRNSFGSDLRAIDLTRIEQFYDWALAAAIETSALEGETATQFYTTRTFRQEESGCWAITSPSIEAWGSPAGLWRSDISLYYPAFDEPYARAVAPRIALVLSQMAADFGVALHQGEPYSVHITPFPGVSYPGMFNNNSAPFVISPLSPGFPIVNAQSPEEFLLGSLTDQLGHMLLEESVGITTQEPGRFALAHTAVQWEVEQAVQRDATARLKTLITQPPTPLTTLLDPTQRSGVATSAIEMELFLRFALDIHGKEIIAPFLQAVAEADSADGLTQLAFEQDLAVVEKEWLAWLKQ